ALDCASRAFAGRRLDLAAGPLFAAVSFDLGRGQDGVRRRRLALLFHHVIFDGASLAVFERDLAVAYAARRRGVAPRLPELAVQPADHAVWQRRRLGGGALDGQLDWWREQLAGVPALDLPTDRPRPPRRSGHGAVTRFVLPRRVSDAAGRAARELGGTRFMVLLAAFEALLGRHAGQNRFAVGVPVAGRQRSEVADLVGFFVNTLALPADVGGEPSFGALVERVRDGALAAFVRQEVPFAHLVADLAPRRRRDTTPLFQTMFSFDPASPRLELTGAEVRRAGLDAGAARCDLTLLLREEPRIDGEEPLVAGLLEYDRDLFDAATVERFVGHYEELLAAACSHPEVPVEHLSFLTAGERAQVVHEFNDTASAYPRDASLAELVHWQAERRPAAVALAWDGAEGIETLSYERLAEASGRLARRLVAAGVRPGDGVALAAERSPELVVAILAVLEAGGFYVPLDPSYPPHRLAAMADDTDCRLLLATPAVEPDLPPLPGVERWSLAGVAAADAPDAPDASTPRVDGDFYAYVMFTSGSTGRPKGVAVTHRNAVRLVQGSSFADFGPDATWLLFSTTAFDASTLELWAPLTHGGRLALAPPGRLSLADLSAAVGRFGVSHAWWTAGLFHQLIDEAPEALAPLRQVLAGGDVLSPEHVARLVAARPDLAIVNGYGPTENTTFTTTARLDGLAATGGPLPIGRPISNTTTYVVDRHLRPQPVGVPGELVTGGDGVAVGYHGAAAATAEHFVPDPFAAAPGARLYRTGDLACWRLGGRLDFLGRIDRQVKIRGFRVEPGEVEALLATAPGVERCAVVARGDGAGGKRLVAYVVGDAAVEVLRGWLGERLPEHLRPAAFVALEELPLNANGKVDRGALPEPRQERREGDDYEAPRTATEEEVAAAWAQLLDADRVGRGDDFFSLGGHSLLATRAVSWLARRYGVELSLADFFDAPTVAEVAARVDDLGGGAAESGEALVPVDRRQPLPISYAQERLWFLDRLEPESTSYNVPFGWDVEGDLDAAALAQAVGDLVRRHEALRTRFAVVGDGPESQQLVQVIDPPAAVGEPCPVERFDLSPLPHGERAAALERTSHAFARRHMDLAEGPLFHAFHADLGRGADGVRRHRFAALFHHVVSDGWSLAVFERELTAAYAARLAGGEPELPELPLQPADHAVWQRRRLDAGVADRELEWWRERLADVPVLELPTDRPRPAQLLGRGAVYRFRLPAAVAEAAHGFARGAAASPFMVFLAAFEAVIARWAGQRRFAVGTPVAGRDRAEIEGLIGFFVNTLALPADLSGDPSFTDLVASVRATALAAYDRQQLPFSRLVERLAPQRRMSHTPFYQVMFTLQNTPPGDLALPGAEVRREPLDVGAARADLSLLLRRDGETEGALTGVVEYDRDLFDAATVERFCGHFATFLAAALEQPETPFDRLPLMDAAEAEQVVEVLSGRRVDYPRDASMVDLFRARAGEHGARPALAWLDAAGEVARLSYADLDAASDHLARRLVATGVAPGDGVALASARSPEMLLGLLAILKAGGHYVPLDPDYPAERLAFMATDSGCRLALVAPGAESALDGTDLPSLSLAGVLEPAVDDAETAAVRLPRPSAELPIYVMYTSGSTGRPKGVVVTHRNAVRLVQGATLTDFGPHATWLCNATIAFDASTLELWSPLAHGGCLAVVPSGLSLAELAAAVGRLGVTHAFFTCGLFSQLVDENVTALASVDHLFTGGDVAPVAAMRRVFEALPGTPVTNCYGPTENGTCTATHRVAERDLDGAIPIGRPVENSTVYVVDRHLRPQPVGIPGELVTGGDGVAIGYLGRPALTAERFIPDPFASQPGSRLYLSGDLARWRSDGLLDFLGRLDHQVKVRGFRIELGEVEASLSGAPGVAACAVVVRDDPPAEKRMVAYVVAEGEEDAPALRSWLAERLPAFMLPTQWMFLDALPYSAAGKLDRKALPAPAVDRAAAGEYRAPRNAVERELAELWARLLGVERVGVDDDFFELGGHSLLATRVVSWLGRRFGAELPLRTLFAAPTVAALAAEVAGAAVAAAPPKPLGRERPLPASYGQERLWFLERFEPGTTAYLIPGALRLRGPLDRGALENALAAVVARHEALRTRFVEIDGRPYQEAAPPPERFPLGFADLTALPEARREAAAEDLLAAERATPFDLGGGLLLRAVLLRLDDEEHVLSWVMHHLVSDGWSAGLLLRDLGAFYRAEVEGGEAELPELPVQYADFAAWQRDWLDSPAMELELGYWRQRLAGSGDGLDLPTDRPRPRVQGQRAGNLRRHLAPEVAKRVNDLARAAGATPFMVLLAAFDAVLSRLSGQTDLSVGTPIAGRARSESEELIGFFLNNLVLRLDLSGDPTFGELVARAKEAAGGAFAHQEVPFERLIQELEPERDPSRTPFFQVMLNLVPPVTELADFGGLDSERVLLPAEHSKFDLTLYVRTGDDGFGLGWVWNLDLFDAARIEEMAAQLEHVLAQACAAPELRLSELTLATPRATALPDPGRALPAVWDGPVHELVSRRAAAHPERPALADVAESWSYGELEARANRLANALIAAGVRRGDRVVIRGHRSAQIAVAVLGVMKSGGAFVVLDPAHPAPRRAFMVRHTQPQAMVVVAASGEVEPEVAEALAEVGCTAGFVLPSASLDTFTDTAPNVPLAPADACYVAFTSGSTGQPKGIVGTHGSLARYLPQVAAELGAGEERVSLLAGLSHDPLHRDLFVPLQLGGFLAIPEPERVAEPGWLAGWFADRRITWSHMTPGMSQLLTEPVERGESGLLPELRRVIFYGDKVRRSDVERLRALAPNVEAVLSYGSTETARAASYHRVDPAELAAGAIIPLGQGGPDSQLLVLDRCGRRAGIGELGEIWVRGPNMGRGYLVDAAATAERWRPHPGGGEAGERIYRTGDLGRHRPDGEVVFAGRADGQVKIRGFRVEPAEVEAVLASLPEVSKVAVVPFDDPALGMVLAAYVVTGEAAFDAAKLRRAVAEVVPEYMVPAAFTRLDELPLNANGKLDRKALPAPEPAAVVAAGEAGELPRSPLEELVVEVWRELLAAPHAGIHDDFFALGGHSLLATRAVSRLRQTAGVELPLAALFESPTPAALAERLEEELRGAAGVAMPPLERAEGDGPWPLSFSQQRQWFLEQIDPGSPAYLIPTVLAVSGPLEAGVLGDTLAALVARHEPLRTTFPLVDGEPVQQVEPVGGEVARAAAELRYVDLAGLPETERSAEAERLRHAEAHAVFDLAAGPLMRSLLVRLGSGEHRLHVTVHHIVTDGWSSAVLMRELVALYDARAAGRPSPLEPLPVRYGDYTLWQHDWMSGEVLDRQLDWWSERLTDVPALELPTDRPRPAVQTHRGARTGLDLGTESTVAMRQLARGHGATPFMVVTAAFEALLARLTGQRRFALGTFVANRHRAEIEPLVGFFVNSLALAADLEGDPSFDELLGRVRETTLGAYAHQDVPFERLLDELHPQRDMSRSPIFQAMVVGLAVGEGIDGEEGRHWQPLIRDSDRAAVDLTVWIYERGDDVRLELEYNRDLFDEATAATILGRLGRVLTAVSADASLTLGELPLVAADEHRRLLAAGNATGDRLNNLSPLPVHLQVRAQAELTPEAATGTGDRLNNLSPLPVHLQVRAQAERTPEAVAVVAGNESLTYAELLGAARAVARRLAARSVGPDDLVAVCLDRSPRLLVSMLGVHLAGAGYLPLDPAYPAERLAYLVEDSRTRLVLTDRRLAGELPVLSSAGAEVLAVDAADATAMGPEPLLAEELDAGAGLDRLAYVIYTSGSTGRPKGVAVPHRALAAFTAASAAATRVGPADRVLQFASPSFDTSAEEIWPTLAHGGTLVLREDTMLASAASFLGRCEELGITLLDLPTAFWHQVASAVGDGLELPASLTRVIIGGEAALAERLAEWHAGDGGGVELFNTYGPTETTVVATQWSIGSDGASGLPDGRVPIGRPLPAVRAYALGAGFELVPEGATGELCLAGDHLARGYLGRPALTADAFRPDPHSAAPGGRLYRTGDLVRWRPDGHGLDYLGRRDDQVKVRGFRVELGEVEAAVSRHPGVRQAAVAAPRDASGVASLVAWVVADDGRLPDDLREVLRRELPDHMVPSVFVPLDEMPLNAHGKIDRAALPAPGAAAASDHVPPSTAAEELLAEIWAEVLDVERIGADDDFFALGGHSLRATQVVTRLAREIDLELPVRQLFMTPTLRELARNVEDRLLAEEGLEGASDDTLEAS
ncbi:MAG TPA: amino acid adenylation domain-containing protein, partial [Thermoanaerobaculia bacterium]|nr:amino acid adenylation domain-containing protein [Thermoanaerobaculia bacterium]